MTNYNNTQAGNSTQQSNKKSMMNEDFVYDGDDSFHQYDSQNTGGSSINQGLDRNSTKQNQRE